MKQFVGVVHHEGDSSFGVTFPDLPGCFAASDTMHGIVAAGVEALALWFEDQNDDIVPTAPDQIDPEGGTLVFIPWVRKGGTKRRVNVVIENATLTAVDACAKQRGMTRSDFLAAAALAEIEGKHA